MKIQQPISEITVPVSNESYWSDYMKDIVPEYLTADR